MALSPQHKLRLRKLAGHTMARYIALVGRTSEHRYEPVDAVQRVEAAHPCIMAFWHGQFMTIPAVAPKTVPTRIMVARHGDADALGFALERFPHMQLIRGAGAGGRQKDRGGAAALRLAMRALSDGFSIAMTADVPPGPARRAGQGIVTLARLSGRPILPVAVASSRYHSFDTWSRMTLNLPFSKLGIVVGQPIVVPREADEAMLEQYRADVEAALDAATLRAYALAGADPGRATPIDALAAHEGPPAEPGFSLKAYRAATMLARPAMPALLRHRLRKGKEDPARLGERLGQASAARPAGRLAWLHAASVGETLAVLPLIDAMTQARPDLHFLLTTVTRTSADLAVKRLPPCAVHQYAPLDAPDCVRRFLDHWRPDLGIFTESEIWPNLVMDAAGRGVPLALVNARMSNRSFGRWRRLSGLSRPVFNRFAVVLAQNEKLARRFAELGAPHAIAAGNLKLDAPPPPVDRIELERLRSALGLRSVFLAVSTHDGEEAAVAIAHRKVRQRCPDLCTIVAPRHPERGLAVAELMKGQGLRVAQRSLGELPDARCDIYVADTIGELGTLYALCPIAFIGGSLVEHGGQNPIEAVRHRTAVLTGPHWDNFRDAYQVLIRHKGAVEVASGDALADAVARLMSDRGELDRMRTNADTALASLSGALEKTLEALLPILPKVS